MWKSSEFGLLNKEGLAAPFIVFVSQFVMHDTHKMCIVLSSASCPDHGTVATTTFVVIRLLVY